MCISLTGHPPDDLSPARADWVRRRDWNADDPDIVQTWTLRANGRMHYRLRYAIEERIEFILDQAGARVWATWTDGAVPEDVASFLLGPVLGRVLRLRGVPCLHASVVAIGKRALAIVGPKGAGKSTTAAGLASAGFPVLSDDIAALTADGGTCIVQPGERRLRLWNPAITRYYGSRDHLPRVYSGRGKRYLSLASGKGGSGWRYHPDPLPLAAFYLLGAREPTLDAPSVRALSPSQGLMALTANSYASHMLTPESRAREFNFLGELVRHVPVRQVERPDGIGAVDRLCAVIRDDFERL